MPTYEYRCLACDERFEQRTSFATADEACCPNGHAEVKRLLSTFGVARVTAGVGGGPAPAPAPTGGGCCGGGCGCG
ncbi:MAG: zinc ribbon domain-containing protein [Acidimicrobiales bacterium]|nr:zinc ribbon domain-containing protein [Acidimicrobiales bacterium]